tara:strand:+ start:5882 stop:6136 length:255 start_codon:yes stop_codon:yes gene_type:complete
MQCGQKTRNCEVLFFFVWREGQGGGWRIFEKKKGKKKKGKVGGRERTRDEGEQETNKKKTDLQISLFFPATSPLFSERKKKKKA